MTDTPDAPETTEPADRSARTPTAEFRVPDVTKTRDDIAVRRPEAATTRAERLPTPPEAEDDDQGSPSEPGPRTSEPGDETPPHRPAQAAAAPEDTRQAQAAPKPHTAGPPGAQAAQDQTPPGHARPDDDPATAQQQTPRRPADTEQREPSAPRSEAPTAHDRPDGEATETEPRTPDTSTPQAPDETPARRQGAVGGPAEEPQHTSDAPGGGTPADELGDMTSEGEPSTPDTSDPNEAPTAPDRPGTEAAEERRPTPSTPGGRTTPDERGKAATERRREAPGENDHTPPTTPDHPNRNPATKTGPRTPQASAPQPPDETPGGTADDRRQTPPHRPANTGQPGPSAHRGDTPTGHERPGAEAAETRQRASGSPGGGTTADERDGAADVRRREAPGASEHYAPGTTPEHDRPNGGAATEAGPRGTGAPAPVVRRQVPSGHGPAGAAAPSAPAPHVPGRAVDGWRGADAPHGVPEAGRTSVDVPVPEGYRRADGEGPVRFVGFEPTADVPRVAAAPEDERAGRRAWPWVLVAVLVVVMAVVTAQLLRPVPDPELRLTIAAEHTFPGAAPRLPWPGSGQSAVFVEGLGMMGTAGAVRPAPTASVAKVMTAYVYLRDHPLRAGEPGPTLTVSPEGVAQMPMRRQRGESLLGITQGQRLTQRKALEALMIISANDVAHELAKWDAGSVQAFVAKMNAAARELGMTSTTYTDPSGYDSGTVSTAADQVKLLRAAMSVPAFAEIVNQRTFVPADGGPVRQGGNFLLGRFGVVGGKTGFTDAAGGNFVFAARTKVAGVPTLIVGAVMGQRTVSAAGAVSAAGELVRAAEGALTSATLAAAGARVAVVDDGLGGTTPVRAASAVTVVGWPGLTVDVAAEGDPPQEAAAGAETGTLTAGAARVPLRFGTAYDGPSLVDRVTRVG